MTSAEYAAYQARQMNVGAINEAISPEPKERDLHAAILAECRRRRWIAFHGSMAHQTHRTIGEPDFIIVAEKRVMFVECKRRGGKLTNEQQAIAEWLRTLGWEMHKISYFSQFMTVIADNDRTEPRERKS